ncbi:hypothetical protein E2C01_090578 [Portunus trituberculatus]|uniref:Uncharacterized protein n=1 Tax=Portunus trituberculatus TaxID=210409 RepID=A0A5B7JBR6_PORTR|nr:hypothetical protein [Portunus trituberculatus]
MPQPCVHAAFLPANNKTKEPTQQKEQSPFKPPTTTSPSPDTHRTPTGHPRTPPTSYPPQSQDNDKRQSDTISNQGKNANEFKEYITCSGFRK